MKSLCSLIILLSTSLALAASPQIFRDQTVIITDDLKIGAEAFPDASAIVDMASTTQGLLIPRMDTTARDNISSPADGLLIYNTATMRLNQFDGSIWIEVGVQDKVKISSNDTTADFLVIKLVAGSNITLTELNDGGNETLQISATGGGGGGDEFDDSLFRIIGSADATKKLAFEVDGFTTATTRTITVGDEDIDISTGASGSFANANLNNLDAPVEINEPILPGTASVMGASGDEFTEIFVDKLASSNSMSIEPEAGADFSIIVSEGLLTVVATNLTGTSGAIMNNTADEIGNSFANTVTGNISEMEFNIRRVGTLTGTIHAVLYDDDGPGGEPGTLLGTSSNIDAATVPTGATQVTFSFIAGPAVIASNTYHAVMQFTNVSGFPGNTVVVGRDGAAGYAGGQIYSNDDGGGWGTTSALDMNFAVTVASGSGNSVTVSAETISITAGLGGLAIGSGSGTWSATDLTFTTTTGDITLEPGADLISVGGDIRPDADATLDLGVSGSQFADIWVTNIKADTALTIEANSGAGSIAINAGSFSMGSTKISDLATPTAGADAATKAYVDSVASGGPEFADDVWRVTDNLDSSKKLAFEISGLSTSTVRTVTWPDVDVDISTFIAHLNSVADGKHNADEIDFEDLAVSGKNVSASTTEVALTALDDAIGDLTFVPSNYVDPGSDIVADHLQNIDDALVLVTGDVIGPGAAIDNAVARFDGTTGKIIQNNVAVTIEDLGTLKVALATAGAGALILQSTDDSATNPIFQIQNAASSSVFQIEADGSVAFADGDAGAPGISFAADPDTGIFRVGANSIGFSAGAGARMTISDTAILPTEPIQASNGLVTEAAYGFTGMIDGGLYRDGGSDEIRLAINGVDKITASDTEILINDTLQIVDGTEGTSGECLLTIDTAGNTGFDTCPTGGTVFADDVFRIQDQGDASKEIAFQASGITTSTIRTITMPDTDVDLGDIATNTSHSGGSGSDHSDVALNTTHRGSAGGGDHSDVATNNSKPSGSGTGDRLTRWDGSSALQDSVISVADTTGNLQDTSQGDTWQLSTADQTGSTNSDDLEIKVGTVVDGDGGDLKLIPGGEFGSGTNGDLVIELRDFAVVDFPNAVEFKSINNPKFTITGGGKVIVPGVTDTHGLGNGGNRWLHFSGNEIRIYKTGSGAQEGEIKQYNSFPRGGSGFGISAFRTNGTQAQRSVAIFTQDSTDTTDAGDTFIQAGDNTNVTSGEGGSIIMRPGLSTADNDGSIDLDGLITQEVSNFHNLLADNQNIVPIKNIQPIESNNAIASNRTFTIQQCIKGQTTLTLWWRNTNAGELIDDSANGGGGNVRLDPLYGDWRPKQHDTLTLFCDGTDWREISRTIDVSIEFDTDNTSDYWGSDVYGLIIDGQSTALQVEGVFQLAPADSTSTSPGFFEFLIGGMTFTGAVTSGDVGGMEIVSPVITNASSTIGGSYLDTIAGDNAGSGAGGNRSDRAGNSTGGGNGGTMISAAGDAAGAGSTGLGGVHEVNGGNSIDGDAGNVRINPGDATGSGADAFVDVTASIILSAGGIQPGKVTADPCGDTVQFPEGTSFYNDTSNYYCFCDGTNDVQMHSPATACF